MSTHVEDVTTFHKKFELPVGQFPTMLPHDVFYGRVEMIFEELKELMKAHRTRQFANPPGHIGDIAEVADALIDLTYFVAGTAVMMGLGDCWQELWDEVQRANMTKERVIDKEQSKRLNPLDVYKPKGWTPPDLQAIIFQACVKTSELTVQRWEEA